MKRLLAAFAVTAILIAAAHSQIWIMSPSGGGVASGSHGPPPPPPTCAGVIDLSVGCALPMFGGIP